MLVGQRGPAGRDRRLHARLVEADGVEISLDEQSDGFAPDALARPVEREQCQTLLIERRVGGIEVFRLALALEETSAEPNDAPALTDGNGQPAAEPVIESLPLFAGHAEACLFDAFERVRFNQ